MGWGWDVMGIEWGLSSTHQPLVRLFFSSLISLLSTAAHFHSIHLSSAGGGLIRFLMKVKGCVERHIMRG
jgi:hypothetical protein